MSAWKVMAGVACLVAAVFCGVFAWVSFVWGALWFRFVPAFLTAGLVVMGLFLILKCRSVVPERAKVLMVAFTGLLIVSPLVLDLHIRHLRRALQARAAEFLGRPVPEMFQTNEIAGYQARPDETVLSVSRGLIERYAKNGRIRWSAWIVGQMAVQPLETAACGEAAQSDKAARVYVADCMAIISEEWQMGFWQWVEDTMELKRVIPEIEEEDARPAPATKGAAAQ